MLRSFFWLLLGLMPAVALAQTALPVTPGYNSTACPGAVVPCFVPYGATMPTTSSAATYQGTATLTAATSTALTSGNVVMTSGTLPAAGSFAFIFAHNIGANPAQFCPLSNTCSATTGDLLPAGGARWLPVTGSAAAPSFYSTLGTTISFDN